MASRRSLILVRSRPSPPATRRGNVADAVRSAQVASLSQSRNSNGSFPPANANANSVWFAAGSRLVIVTNKHGLPHVARFLSSGELPPHQELGMPSLSPTITQVLKEFCHTPLQKVLCLLQNSRWCCIHTSTKGNIAKWLVKEGDQVAPGDVLCEIETDKATLEMEAMEEGYLAKILCGDGSKDIPVGQAIAIIVESEEDVAKFSNYRSADSASSKESSNEKESPPPPHSEAAPEQPPSKQEASKLRAASATEDRVFARKLTGESNVPLPSLKGTDRNGCVLKADVVECLASGATPAKGIQPPAPLDFLDYIDIPNSQIRRVTAQRLLLSKQTIPHYYLTVDTCADKLLFLRKQLNEIQEASGGKRISVNDFVLKAAALALRKVPECNSSWTEDFIRQYKDVNISVAVQTDFGLLVPVVKETDKKGLATIAENVKTLAEKAKQNSLKPSDYEGGTFTVSNLGGPFGVKQFCAIINPPQACILAVGSIEERVIPGQREGELTAGSFMPVTLSCDHRVVDGAIGARWLRAFKGYIENPVTLLL